MQGNLVIWKKNDLIRDEIDIIDFEEKSTLDFQGNPYFGFVNRSSFDGTFHFFTYSNKAKIKHLHIYRSIRTGDSRLKQFDFTRLYNHSNITIDDFSQFLCCIRFYLKFARPYSLLKFIKEYSLLKKDKTLFYKNKFTVLRGISISCINKETICSLESEKNIIKMWFKSNYLYKNLKSEKYIDYVYKYSIIRYLQKIIYQIRNKVLRTKRLPLFESRVVSICGPDGSGKSTIGKFLHEFISSQSGCFYFHYGLPNLTSFDKIKNKILNSNRKSNSKKTKGSLTTIKKIYYLDLAYRRLRTSLVAYLLSKLGYIIIFDRYYNTSLKDSVDCANIHRGLFSFIERYLYSLTPMSDLSIFLKTDIENVVEQNLTRKKDSKETTEEIKERYHRSAGYEPYSKIIEVVHNIDINLSRLKYVVLKRIYKN